MGIDRGLVRAFGYLSCAVIALGAGVSFLVARATGNFDAMVLFLPLLVAYSALIALCAAGLAVYVFLRSKARAGD